MADKKNEKPSEAEEIYEDLKLILKGEKKFGEHFTAVKELEKLPPIKNPHEAAAELAKQFYKALGYDVSMYKTTDEILGHLVTQVGEENYGKIMSYLNRKKPEVIEAYKAMKEAHKEHYTGHVVGVKKSRLQQMPYEAKVKLARKLKEEHKGLKSIDEAVIAEHLPSFVEKEAKFEAESNAMEGATPIVGEKYEKAIKEEFTKYQEEKKKYQKKEEKAA